PPPRRTVTGTRGGKPGGNHPRRRTAVDIRRRQEGDPMQHVHPIRLIRAPLPLALLVSGILIAGCGGSSDSVSTVAAAGGAARTDTSTTTGGGATTSPPDAPANTNQTALAFSRCMRANGVPSFPDPSPGGGFLFNANGVDRSSPAFKEAQVKCSKLLAGSGPPLPGTQTHPTAQTL